MGLARHLRALRISWSASIQAEMEYRFNFVVAALTSAGTLAGVLFGVGLFYQQGYGFGDWTWDRVLVVIGVYTFLEGFHASFLAGNGQRLTEYVREGTLDFVLLKPIDSQLFVSLREVSLWGIPNMVLGALIVVAGGARLGLGPADYLAGVVPVALGALILYGFGFLLATLTIWFVKLWNITIAMQSLLQAGKMPIDAYPSFYRLFFTFLMPVAFMTTVPAKALMGTATLPWLAGAAAAAAALLVASRLFWRFALRYYTSASS